MTDRIPRRSRRLGLRRQTIPAAAPVESVMAASKPANTKDILAPKSPPNTKPSPSPSVPPLKPKYALFVQYYLIDRNATQAAIKAGFSKKTAHVQGGRLLRNAAIAAAISKKTEKVMEKLDISRERIQLELCRMGLANMQDYMRVGPSGAPVTDFSDLTRDQAAALQEITVEEFTDGRSDKRKVRRVKFKLADKTNALLALGKDLGMFRERHEHNHTVTLVGDLLDEIDQDGRGAKLIEQLPQGNKID